MTPRLRQPADHTCSIATDDAALIQALINVGFDREELRSHPFFVDWLQAVTAIAVLAPNGAGIPTQQDIVGYLDVFTAHLP
jgi:hypothetical protein